MNNSSAGQLWRKVDLHVHTPASKDYVGPDVTPDEFLSAVAASGVDAFAVTDHNSAEWIDRIKAAADTIGLPMFPGVELTVTGGKEGSVHLVALFDRDAESRTIENLLGKLEISAEDYGTAKACSPCSPEQAIKTIAGAGALPILAHADSSKGVLHDMKGEPRKRVMNLPELAGVEASNVGKLRKMLDGTDKNYRRKLAVYRASDNRADDQSGHDVAAVASRCSYFKMDVIDLEALRQCLCDPEVRILTDVDVDEPPGRSGPRLTAIEVSKGFLHGRYEFHDGLNCIVGGKGAGKSLLVELVRFALDQPSDLEAITKDHALKLERLLGFGGVVSVELTTTGGQRLVVQRTYDAEDSPISLTDLEAQEPVAGTIKEIFPITAYSQTEAIEIARDSEAQLKLIDSMLELAPTRRKIREVVRALEESDHDIVEATAAVTTLEDMRTDLATVVQQLQDLERLLESKEYEDYKASEIRTDALASLTEAYGQLEAVISSAIGDHKLLGGWVIPRKLKDDRILSGLADGLKTKSKEVGQTLAGLKESVARERAQAEVEAKEWKKKVGTLRKVYEKWAEHAGGEHHELLRRRDSLKEGRDALQNQIERLSEVANRLPKLVQSRTALLDRLDKAREDIYRQRKEKYDRITSGTAGKLRLEIDRGADRNAFASELIRLSKGSYARHDDLRDLVARISPRELFWYLFTKDGDGICKSAKVPEDLVRRLLEECESASEEEVLSLQYRALVEDIPRIQLLKEDGKYYALDGLSVGQKCTALLLVALSEQARPILVDQPEDALDIASVYADITSKLRALKTERQFVLTTHNPTVAVAGDADKFLVLKATATQGHVATEGAIERGSVKREIILHLEGGPEPFGLKSRKYGAQVEADG